MTIQCVNDGVQCVHEGENVRQIIKVLYSSQSISTVDKAYISINTAIFKNFAKQLVLLKKYEQPEL